MSPLTNGYYQSDRIHVEDWHAGVKMTSDYFRFVKFFEDGFCLWCDYGTLELDFQRFLRGFDIEKWRKEHLKLSPPTSAERDGGHLFEFGIFVLHGQEIILSFSCPIAEMTFQHTLTILNNGQELRGWNQRFRFHGNTIEWRA